MTLPAPRRYLILSILIFILLFAFVMSGCSQLSSKESTTNKKFEALIPELSARYNQLAKANELAIAIGGQRDVTKDIDKNLKEFKEAKKTKNSTRELIVARELENNIGRLRANAASSPKLSVSGELKAELEKLEGTLPGKDLVDQYKDSVKNYEQARTSWRNLISALLGGYSAPTQLEFSTVPK